MSDVLSERFSFSDSHRQMMARDGEGVMLKAEAGEPKEIELMCVYDDSSSLAYRRDSRHP